MHARLSRYCTTVSWAQLMFIKKMDFLIIMNWWRVLKNVCIDIKKSPHQDALVCFIDYYISHHLLPDTIMSVNSVNCVCADYPTLNYDGGNANRLRCRSKSNESASFLATTNNTTGTAFILGGIYLSFFVPD